MVWYDTLLGIGTPNEQLQDNDSLLLTMLPSAHPWHHEEVLCRQDKVLCSLFRALFLLPSRRKRHGDIQPR